LRKNVESCLAQLHGDLRFYTTAMFTDDVNQVLGALGYTRANLIGGSYGTAAAAAVLMHDRRVKRLPVVDGAGRLMGIVSRVDVLAVFTRPDEEIST
jgi:pimeloyl-ACP methyl ester carboxylesterase